MHRVGRFWMQFNKQGNFFNFLDLNLYAVWGKNGYAYPCKSKSRDFYHNFRRSYATMNEDGTVFKVSRGDVIVNQPGGSHGFKKAGPVSFQRVVIEMRQSRE